MERKISNASIDYLRRLRRLTDNSPDLRLNRFSGVETVESTPGFTTDYATRLRRLTETNLELQLRRFSTIESGQDYHPHSRQPSDEVDGIELLNARVSTDQTGKKEPEPTDSTQYMNGFALQVVILALTLASFLLMIDSTILVTAIPSITSQFDSLKDVGWYASSYLLATCALQLLFGKVYQYYSSKLIFITAFVVFEIGSLICAVARSSMMFIVGRSISGMGGAGILNGAFTIVAAAAPMEKRPKLIGAILGVASTGVALGPLLGGALTEHASWRWCFYINLPVGAITVATLTFARVPEGRLESTGKATVKQHFQRLDIPGCSLFAGAVIMLLLAIDWGGVTYTWTSSIIVGLFCGAGVTFIVFLVWEHFQGESAMLPLRLLRKSSVACAAAAGIMSYAGLYVIIVYLPLWFQTIKNVSPLMSGVYYLPSVITTTLATIISGIIVSKVGYYTPVMIIGSALASIAAGLLSILKPGSSAAAWVCFQLLNGIARGMMSQQPVTAIQANLSKEELSIGTALVVFCQNFGAAVFVSLGQTTFENSLLPDIRDSAPGVNAERVAAAGATDWRSFVPADMVDDVLRGYNKALTTTFYLSVGTSVAVFALAFGMGWKSVKQEPAIPAAQPTETGDALLESSPSFRGSKYQSQTPYMTSPATVNQLPGRDLSRRTSRRSRISYAPLDGDDLEGQPISRRSTRGSRASYVHVDSDDLEERVRSQSNTIRSNPSLSRSSYRELRHPSHSHQSTDDHPGLASPRTIPRRRPDSFGGSNGGDVERHFSQRSGVSFTSDAERDHDHDQLRVYLDMQMQRQNSAASRSRSRSRSRSYAAPTHFHSHSRNSSGLLGDESDFLATYYPTIHEEDGAYELSGQNYNFDHGDGGGFERVPLADADEETEVEVDIGLQRPGRDRHGHNV